jgi:hypothetical protein
MKELIEENRRKRALFLKKLYELSGGVAGMSVDVRNIRDALGFTEHETIGFRKYFEGEGSLKAKGTNLAVYVSLTDNGIKEVEKMMNPEKPTEKNVSITLNLNNSTVGFLNTGVSEILNSEINVLSKNSETKGIASAIAELAKAIADSKELDSSQRDEAIQTLEFVAEEANKPKEKRKIAVVIAKLVIT